MNRVKLNLILVCFCFAKCVVAQDTVKGMKSISWQLSVAKFGLTNLNSITQGTVADESKFVLSSFYKQGFSLEILKIHMALKNKFGLEFNLLSFSQNNLNTELIRSNFHNYIEGYKVSFKEQNYNNGVLPISGGYNTAALSLGVFRNIKLKNILLRPYLNYKFLLGKQKVAIEADFVDLTNQNEFKRKYNYSEKPAYGFNAGIEVNYVFKNGIYTGIQIGGGVDKYKGEVASEDVYTGNLVVVRGTESYQHFYNNYVLNLIIGVDIRKIMSK